MRVVRDRLLTAADTFAAASAETLATLQRAASTRPGEPGKPSGSGSSGVPNKTANTWPASETSPTTCR
jgi:hypothetical protein